MRYGSVCSGIEAASVAWEPLGWTAAWFSEIEKFPSAVLAQRWPLVPNVGDMTLIADAVRDDLMEAPEILVGGTPCQAFSVAGLRKGLDDKRGLLTLSYVELANAIDDKRRERGEEEAIIVWENVPGVLSSKDNAFGCFLAGLAGESSELQPAGGKWTHAGCVSGPQRAIAWRVLDAQFFGVAQRRRRVFVVASARKGFDPGTVLFELDSVRRDTPPRREPQSTVAALTANGVGTCGADDNQGQAGHLIAIAIAGNIIGRMPANGGNGTGFKVDLSYTLTKTDQHGVAIGMKVRRLTPRECERLQGFPDDHTLVPYGRRITPEKMDRDFAKYLMRGGRLTFEECCGRAADGPRYNAIGNSMAVPVMRWIGERIATAVNADKLPQVVSFSGGRTSAYLVYLMEQKRKAGYNVHFTFMDTGAEHPATYQFIRDLVTLWGIPLVCLRVVVNPVLGQANSYRIVPLGEIGPDLQPMRDICEKYGTPYVHGAFCTRTMKMEVFKRYCKDTFGEYHTWLGIRADEPKRLKIRDGVSYLAEVSSFEKQDVLTWWKDQPFDLGIPEHLGNCVFCIKKGINKVALAARDEPVMAAEFWKLITDPAVRVVERRQQENKIMYRGNNSLESVIALFAEHSRDEIAATISSQGGYDAGSCTESCEAFACDNGGDDGAPVETKSTPHSWQRPFLKWAGGKYSLLPELDRLIPAGKRLIEPFVGGGSVFLNSIKHADFLLADVNADLINLYQMLAVVPDEVEKHARLMFEKLCNPEDYESVRREFNAQTLSALERAAAFLYLNRHCFNGLTRYNLSNQFNVGWGKYRSPYFPEKEIKSFTAMAHNCVFMNAGFRRTLSLAGSGDVVYCDPPYEPLPGTDGFTAYAAGGFNWDEQVALVECCVAANQRGANIVISNSGSPRIAELYSQHGFTLHNIKSRRSVSCKGATRGTAADIIATMIGAA